MIKQELTRINTLIEDASSYFSGIISLPANEQNQVLRSNSPKEDSSSEDENEEDDEKSFTEDEISSNDDEIAEEEDSKEESDGAEEHFMNTYDKYFSD